MKRTNRLCIMLISLAMVHFFFIENSEIIEVCYAAGPTWAWEDGGYEHDGSVTLEGESYDVNPTGTRPLTGKSMRQPPTVIVQAASSGGGTRAPFCITTSGPLLPGYGKISSSPSLTCYIPVDIEGTDFSDTIKGYTSGPYDYFPNVRNYCSNLTKDGYTNWQVPNQVDMTALLAVKISGGGWFDGSGVYSNGACIVDSNGTITDCKSTSDMSTKSSGYCVRH